MKKINKKIWILLVVLTLLSGWNPLPVSSQTASWDYTKRERSQQVTSAALNYLNKGQVDVAITALLKATTCDASDPLPYSMLGLALDMKGRYDEALDMLHKSYQLEPTIPETLLSIGFTHYLTHNYDKAINAWHKALALNPELCHIYGDIGWAYLRKGEFDQAISNFKHLIACNPNSQVGYHGLANVAYLMGDLSKAEELAVQAQTIFCYPPAVLLLINCDLLQGDCSRASRRIEEYQKLIRRSSIPRPMTALGYSAQHEFHFDPFLADSFDNPSLVQARFLELPKELSRQRSLSRSGKASQAIDTIKQALSTCSEDYFLQRELGLMLMADGQYSDAAENFKKVVTTHNDSNIDLLNYARALSLDGKSAEASAPVREFQKKYPQQSLSPLFQEIARVDPALGDIIKTKPGMAPAVANPSENSF